MYKYNYFEHPYRYNLGGVFLKKILRFIPFFLFLLILLWGFINVNIQNTQVFNNNYIDSDDLLDSEKISKNTGIDLTIFNQDKSIIKIYSEDNALKVVINNKDINLDERVIGKIAILVVNSINNLLSCFNDLINNAV